MAGLWDFPDVWEERDKSLDKEPKQFEKALVSEPIPLRPSKDNCSCEPLSREILQEAVDHIRAQHDRDKITE